MTQIIYAKDSYYDRTGSTGPGVYGPRFDTIFVRNNKWVEDDAVGWEGLDVYRVRLFFSLRFEGRRLALCLADVWDRVSCLLPCSWLSLKIMSRISSRLETELFAR